MSPYPAEQLRQYIELAKSSPTFAGRWLRCPSMDVYVKKSLKTLPNNKPITALEIDNFHVCEALRGKGVLTTFLNEAHVLNPWDCTFIGEVAEPRLQKHLEKLGFLHYKHGRNWQLEVAANQSKTFYKLTTKF